MDTKAIASYVIEVEKIPLQIYIYSQKGSPVPFYYLSLLNITDETKKLIEKTRESIITGINFELAKKRQKKAKKR